MDIDLQEQERNYSLDPTYENLERLVILRLRYGLEVDDLGKPALTMAWQMTCKHPEMTYLQDESRYWEPELPGYTTEQYHWYECFDCGLTDGHGPGWKEPYSYHG